MAKGSGSMKKGKVKFIEAFILSVLFTSLVCLTAYGAGQKEKIDDTQPGEGPERTEGLDSQEDLELKDTIELKDAVLKAEDLMQRGRFAEADAVLVKGPIPQEKSPYASWLRALVLYQIPDYPLALQVCLDSMRETTPWQHKIRFLAAEIYLKQRRYEEAESIYEQEAQRLLSEQRKEDIAGVYIEFAETLSYSPRPEELDLPQPDYDQAYSFYQKALDLEIGPELSEKVRFQMALMRERAELYGEAVWEYRSYLRNFDPDWLREGYGEGSRSVSHPGRHRGEARYRLAESLIKTGEYRAARNELEDLLSVLETLEKSSSEPATGLSQEDDMHGTEQINRWRRLAMRRIPFTYGFPRPGSEADLEAGLSATTDYLSRFPDDAIAVTAAWYAVSALNYRGRTDEAIGAARDFLVKKTFRVRTEESPEEIELRKLVGIAETPLEQYDTLQKKALFLIGNLRFAQTEYQAAIEAYTEYTVRFPNGPDWTAAQRGIINAEYQIGVDLIAARSYDQAQRIWNEFLAKHPLDYRSRQILFAFGQIEYQQGKDSKEDGQYSEARERFQSAIRSFQKLVSKYPQTEESGMAQLRIAEILENELGDLKGALDAYRQLTWSSMSEVAKARVSAMTKKELVVRTDRIYRTDETALVSLQLRNVKSLKLSAYRLDLKDYFRKYHTIERVEQLDLALITPDKTWEVPVSGYRDYLPIAQTLEIPIEGAGVYAVNVAEQELEATTLVIRSDIDMIAKSSRSEVLVFAQNMRTGSAVPGAEVLITDGSRVLLEERTGRDGVLHRKLDELRAAGGISVFVSSHGSVASNTLSLQGLGFSRGLAPKGYLYTDRPVYRAGQTVQIRGVVREVVEGAYTVQEGDVLSCYVTDARGRTIFEKEVGLSRFGTFHETLRLGTAAPQGSYSIRLLQENPRRVFTGSFLVEEFRLEKIRLNLEFDSSVYFRGDTITATFTASYYYGKPVAEAEIRYRLPDGRELSGVTDSEGRLRVQFNTTPYTDQRELDFYGLLVSENVEVYGRAFLATLGFRATLSVGRPVSLVGEPVEITVKTEDISGKAVSKEMQVTVLRREVQKPDPLLVSIPWMGVPTVDTWAEKTVETLTVSTNDKGIARFSFTPQKGGVFVYRAKGKDRFGNTVVAETFAEVSGEQDAIKLRLFADRQHYRVGEPLSLRIHSRIERGGLALITHEGEGIITYQVKEINTGNNPLRFTVDHPHFPNFVFGVVVMNGNRLESASLPFTVERQLKIEIQPEKQEYLPGEKAKLTVDVRDHLGEPVETEFSLALVDEALFARYSDPAGDIVAFFQKDAHREGEMRLETSCTFAYMAKTVLVNTDIAEETARVADELARASMEEEAVATERKEPAAKDSYYEKAAEEPETAKKKEAKPSHAGARDKEAPREEGEEEPITRRTEEQTPGFWLVTVATKKTGRASVTVPLPQSISSYRITVKGCTAETLVGEATASVVIKKPFFALLKTPLLFQENDAVRLACEIHNLSDYQGPVKASLTLEAKDRREVFPLNETIGAGETKRFVFPPYTIPAGDTLRATLDVAARPDLKDGLVKEIPIRPWGLPFTDLKSGKSSSDRTVYLELPPRKTYSSRKINLSIGASLNQDLVDLVLGNGVEPFFDVDPVTRYFPTTEPSELLALASLIGYLENRDAFLQDRNKAQGNAHALVAQLSASQRENGGWRYGTGGSEIEVTALAHWALARANEVGVRVDSDVLKRSEGFLRDRYAQVAQDDYELRAMILHALSVWGGTDFAFVNRLFRQRNSLSEAALAYTALCLHALDRRDMGLELLSLLENRSVFDNEPERSRLWRGEKNVVWNRSAVETTALVILAFEALNPSSPQIEEGIRFLMSQRGRFGVRPVKAKGIVAAALAGYYEKVKEGLRDFILEIAVNDTLLETVTVKGQRIIRETSVSRSGLGWVEIPVPDSLIRSGRNKIAFKLTGTGEYFYTASLSGFSQQLDLTPAWEKPKIVSKRYIHENLTYKGHPIGTSTTAINELEANRVATVQIDFSGQAAGRYTVIEDSFPAGATVLKETIRGSHSFIQTSGNRIFFFFEPDTSLYSLSYQISGYTAGDYNVLPPMIRDVLNPAESVLGNTTSLTLLAPGEGSSEPYRMNKGELYGLGEAYFNDGLEKESLQLLEQLYGEDQKYQRREVARMLLWIRSEPEFYDAKRLVEYFEILKENYPDLFIPFHKILVIGKAYHDIGEYERSYLVYRATVEASFLKDAPVGGALEQAGELLGSIDFMQRLWCEYPDSAPVVETYFALAQELYDRAPQAQEITSRLPSEGTEQPTRVTEARMMSQAESMLWRFMALYPYNPLTDDAAFSRVNLALDRRAYEAAVFLCRQYVDRFPESDFASSFRYMEALGFFSMLRYNEAIAAAKEVAEGESEDRELAIYILGQIYHAKQNPALAVSYYKRVSDRFPDAREAAIYFERKEISLDEVNAFKPKETVEIELSYRNIGEAHIQVFQVDLMKLYLKEKNLSRITGIKLSGISPLLETSIDLGTGKEYQDLVRTIPLDLKREGAYLVICRGDDLFTSSLVLITPLEIQVQEDPSSGRVRVNIIDSEKGRYASDVHVKVIGSENERFVSGETDLRGIFIADGINGTPTVIARDRSNRYAFYRGRAWIGAPEIGYEEQIERAEEPKTDYRGNTLRKQQELQDLNRMNLDRLYEGEQEGVQVQEAY
jgi:uncharacterized protein YfaS (alpha-2-macroglobulin family)/tetratricopeptide (TPR) repeat protein